MDQTRKDKNTGNKHWFKFLLWRDPKRKSTHNTVILPPEIQETILERISDQNTLLKCRQVCYHWKQFIDTLLEQRRLSQWTAWDLELNSYIELLHPPIWVVSQTDCEIQSYYSSHICRHPALETENGVSHHFPDKSAALINCGHWHKKKKFKNTCPNPIYYSKETFTEFFCKSGSCLTSLVLHYVFLKHHDFCVIFNESQHLKALSLYDVSFVDFDSNLEGKTPPNLTHLQVCERFTHLDWVIDILFCQLVSLKLVQNYVYRITPCLRKFTKLKQLYIYNDTGIRMHGLSTNPEAFPVLEYFTATGMEPSLSTEKITGFINSLSSIATSLVYFRLRVSTCQIITVFQECGLVFPKVRFLVVVRNSEEPELTKEEILEWFPKLESVTCVVETKWYSHDFGNAQKCFVCDKHESEILSWLNFYS